MNKYICTPHPCTLSNRIPQSQTWYKASPNFKNLVQIDFFDDLKKRFYDNVENWQWSDR